MGVVERGADIGRGSRDEPALKSNRGNDFYKRFPVDGNSLSLKSKLTYKYVSI